MSDLKKHFGSLLKKYIKETNVRQVDIAEALGLSPSAVSQMISGRMSPNLKQLDVITGALSLDRNSCAELRDCLMRIRSGDEDMRSPLNDFIKSSRIRCGLSIDQLSQVSGIKQDTLIMLENKLNVQPTPWEAVRLAAIFNCNLSELWQSVPEPESGVSANSSVEMRVLRDGNDAYRAENGNYIKTPVIRFDDLKKFNAKFDYLVDFAWRHMSEYKTDLPVGLVCIKTPAEEFNWPPVYQVTMEIAEASCWIPGMGVVCWIDDNIVIGKAADTPGWVIPMNSTVEQQCEKYFLLNALRFESDIFAVVNAEKSEGSSSKKADLPAHDSGTKN